MYRKSKVEYYLDIAKAVAMRSTCLRRRYGAIIVKNDEIIATGYNGAPRGEENCIDCNFCQREALNVPKGERYELCVSVHAEQNAIISAARRDMIGATIYIVGLESDGSYANPSPCIMCRRVIVNAGIMKAIGRAQDGSICEPSLEPPKREFQKKESLADSIMKLKAGEKVSYTSPKTGKTYLIEKDSAYGNKEEYLKSCAEINTVPSDKDFADFSNMVTICVYEGESIVGLTGDLHLNDYLIDEDNIDDIVAANIVD